MEKKFFEIGLGNNFLNLMPKPQATRAKNEPVGLHQANSAQQKKQSII